VKTQVSILVQKESAIAKMFSITGIWNLFKKSAVCLYLDSEEAEHIYMEGHKMNHIFWK
jgi:hypothetical protein